MNTSQYMDKQIMDLASQGSSPQSKDFIDLMKHPEEDHQEHAGGGRTNGSAEDVDGLRPDEIVPSYDFQPIRPITATVSGSKSFSYDGGSATKIWSSDDSKLNTSASIRNYSSLDTVEPAKVILEKDRHTFDTSSLVSDIDNAMKKHTDDVLHALEVLSARVTQLESRTRNLENSVDDLKLSVGNNYGSTDGKIRHLENILREVQNGVQAIKDKHDVMEGHLHLAKLQISKPDQPQETHNPPRVDTVQPPTSVVPQQSHQQLPPPPPQAPFQQPLPVPAPIASVPPSQPIHPPPAQFQQTQVPPIPQREPYFPPPGQTQEAPNPLPYQLPPGQQPPVRPPPPHQQYPPPSLPQYSPPANPPPFHHPEEPPYHPSHTQPYPPPGHHQPPSGPPPQQPPSQQQLYAAPTHMYDPPPSRSSSGFPSGYGHTPGANEPPYPYGGPPSQYGPTSPTKPQQHHSQSGGSGYPQLPTARILPQSLPTASGISSGSGSGGTGNRVPIDDVVDKVTTMGFPRDQVRATVRKLTESGQQVDLNIVLDKLMNDSDVQQPPRGWFGR